MQIDDNPLVIPILDILRNRTGSLSEHDIITRLRPQLESLPGLSPSPSLALFQTHFLVMNALYQLQRDLLGDGFYLRISPLDIGLESVTGTVSSELRDASDQPLSEYYLDFANLSDTGEREVEALLNSFWGRYAARDGRRDALATLDLPADAGWPQIQRRYRTLVARSHPDRGGDAQQFMQIREAFEVLSHCHRFES